MLTGPAAPLFAKKDLCPAAPLFEKIACPDQHASCTCSVNSFLFTVIRPSFCILLSSFTLGTGTTLVPVPKVVEEIEYEMDKADDAIIG